MERKSVLEAVRDQSKLALREEHGKWTARQWFECFHFLFVDSPFSAHSLHQDDLLFFVRADSQQQPTPDEPALLVRRKAKQLPQELSPGGRDFDRVDWGQTVLLNLVLQSQFQLTVVACGPEALPLVAEGRAAAAGSGVRSVTRPVFACTSVTAVNMDNSRADAGQPQPCYPDICFAIDNFDDSVDDLVLEHESQCYCVVLQAVLDLHRPLEQQQQQHSAAAAAAAPAGLGGGGSSSMTQAGGSGAGKLPQTSQRTLFAGFVSYPQVVQFMESNARSRGLLGALRRLGGGQQQKDKVVMLGPGGVGRCEVAVTKVKQQQQQQQACSDSGSSSAGSEQQQQQQRPAQAAEGGNGGSSKAAPCSSLLCALMMMQLPVRYVASELLEAVVN